MSEKLYDEVFDVLLEDGATLPKKAHKNDSCFDIYSNEDRLIKVGETAKVKTGLHILFKNGWGGKIRPRSSWFSKGYNIDGTIDAGYIGEIAIVIQNNSDSDLFVYDKERIAQMYVEKVYDVGFVVVDSLEDTERGSGGFGSTGVK